MSANTYYVYEHWRPDKDEPFYVGKGHGSRATRMSRPNKHHQNIQAKLARLGMCVEVRMVASGLIETEAFRIECERIAFWLTQGLRLANRTAGGEGTSNPPAHVRRKMSEAAKGNKRALGVKRSAAECAAIAERMKGNKIWEGREFTDEHRTNLSKALKGRPGRIWTEDEKARVGAASRGKKRSAETIMRMREGIKRSWETRDRAAAGDTFRRVNEARRGRKMTPAELERHRIKIKKTWETRSRVQSEETKAKISEGVRKAQTEGRTRWRTHQ